MRRNIPDKIDGIFRLYSVADSQRAGICRFLRDWPRLTPVLIEAVPYLESVFGQARRHLELEQDPDSSFEELFCVVLAKGDPESALQLLWQFDDIWFSTASRTVQGRLNFTVEVRNDSGR